MVLVFLLSLLFSPAAAEDIKKSPIYLRIKADIDSIPAINTHDHLQPFEKIGPRDQTQGGEKITLRTIWAGSYFPWIHTVTPWPDDGTFDTWWASAQHDFVNARATSFYRYLLPAFRDLYEVDFDTISPAEARNLNRRIGANYESDQWLGQVITERANIELMVIDFKAPTPCCWSI